MRNRYFRWRPLADKSTGRALVIACVALGIVAGCEDDSVLEEVPTEFFGVWRTQDPRYVNRRLEIGDDQVIFQTGEGVIDFTVHSIERTTAIPDEIGMLYTIEYNVEGDDLTFAFYYDDSSGILTFKNQREMEWRREAP